LNYFVNVPNTTRYSGRRRLRAGGSEASGLAESDTSTPTARFLLLSRIGPSGKFALRVPGGEVLSSRGSLRSLLWRAADMMEARWIVVTRDECR